MTNPAVANAPTRRITVNGEVVGPGNPLPVQMGDQDGDQADVTDIGQLALKGTVVNDPQLATVVGLLEEVVELQKGLLRLHQEAFEDGFSSEINEEL